MAHGHSSSTAIRNPGPFATPGGLNTALLVLGVVGIAAFAGGLAVDSKRTWYAFVLNHFFFMSLALGGSFFAVIQWVTGAMWSAPIRRVSEAFTAYLPVTLITFAALYFGIHQIYPWSNPEYVRANQAMGSKMGYLSIGFFMLRNLVVLGVLWFLSKKMIGNSIAQDANGDYVYTARNRTLGPGFLIIFALGFTMMSFDQMMSLDPVWFSTMFGVYCFAGLFYAILAGTCLVTIYLLKRGALTGIVNDNHLHDLGKFMFAFTVFWAYIGFSQFMLIWYANMPEETGYYLHRMNPGWMPVSIFLLVGKFMVPFFFLLPRDSKRSHMRLTLAACFMLFAQWVDVLWMSQPELLRDGPHIGWIELGVTAGFLGVFGLLVMRFLAKNNIVAIGDPRLAESVLHHHQ